MHQIENSYVQVSMRMHDSIKGRSQVLNRTCAIVQVQKHMQTAQRA